MLVTIINLKENVFENIQEGETIHFKKEPFELNEHMIMAYYNGNFIGRISHLKSTSIENTLLDDDIYDKFPETFTGKVLNSQNIKKPNFSIIVEV